MNRRTSIFWSAVLLLVAIVAFDWLAGVRVRRIRAKAGALVERCAMLGRQIQADNQKVAMMARLKVLREQFASGRTINPPAAVGSKSAGAASAVDPLRVIALNPELRAQYLKLFRDGLDADWNLLFHALNLSPDKEEKLKDLLAQYAANKLDIDELAAEQGLDPTDKPMRKLANQLSRQNQNDIAALLGPDAYSTYQEYHQEHAVAPVIGDLAGYLPSGSLTLTQAEQLSQALSAASQKNKYGYVIYGTIDVDQATSNAGNVLTPAQLPVLNALLQKNQAYLQYKKLSGTP